MSNPGGIANKKFTWELQGFCETMDSNDYWKAPWHSALLLWLISKCGFPPYMHSASQSGWSPLLGRGLPTGAMMFG